MRNQHKALITLNVALVVVLAAIALSPGAGAQAGDRPRGSYTLTTGDMQGSEADAIFIVDSSSQDVVTLRFDQSSRSLRGIGYANFSDAERESGDGR